MKKLLTIITLIATIQSIAQDTVVVQTLTYDSTGRDYMFDFPVDDGTTYEKIIMQYSMRCTDGLVSTGNEPNKGCGEWDYSCNTYITDTSYTDSIKGTHPTHVISGFSGTAFNYTNTPTNSYYRFTLKNADITITTEDTLTVGAGTDSVNNTFQTSYGAAKTQYLWTASELSSAGLTTGNISGMLVDVLESNASVEFLRIKMKHTTSTALDPSNPDLQGFSSVFYNQVDLSLGQNDIRFYNDFNWNGTSNILVELSFTNGVENSDNVLAGHDAGFDAAISSADFDNYFELSGSEFLDLGNTAFNTVSDEITVSFWLYGNEEYLPRNTSAFEGFDANGTREVHAHLPWSNSGVYWDCGNVGGYDRINKTATTSQLEGQWRHWAFTKNTNTGVMNIYLDGALWHTGTGKNKLIDLQDMFVGTNYNGAYDYYGNIDDFQLWNKELSVSEISDWMYKELDSSHPQFSNLIADYKLNEGTGSLTTDHSSFGDSAIINGGPNWRFYRGDNIFKGFVASTQRPNIGFFQGTYSRTVNDSIVYDTIMNSANQILYYQLSGSDVEAYDTLFVWKGGYEYIYDNNGVKIDSNAISTSNTINVGSLDYFIKYPMNFEIMSFVTPYGIRLDLGIEGKTWTFDVSDFEPILHGSKRLFMTAGGQNQEEMDIKFLFIKGTPAREVKNIQQIWKVQSKGYTPIVADDFFQPVNVKLDTAARDYKIRTAITGHGQEGEFIPRQHYINIDGGTNEVEWEVWKECADNPVYPQGGTWIFDRAGWCPGMATDVNEHYIDANPGDIIEIDYGLVFGAGGDSRYWVNSQLVSYGSPSFNLDAAVIDVIRPSKKIEYDRINPACQDPIVVIQNTGDSPLTSLTITYGVTGGTFETYSWSDSLGFMETDTITLPIPSSVFWYSPSQVDKFEVTVSAPNGGADEYAQNNTFISDFDKVRQFYGPVEIFVLTNSMPYENSYSLRNSDGDTLLYGEQYFLNSFTEYTDELTLPVGCYSYEFRDDMVGQFGQNGLEFWFYSQFGIGVTTISDSTQQEYFDPDFGAYIKYDFSIGAIYTNDLPEDVPYQLVRLYPNPANDVLNVELHGFKNMETTFMIYNSVGKLVSSKKRFFKDKSTEEFDISGLKSGMYFLQIQNGNQTKTRKFIKK